MNWNWHKITITPFWSIKAFTPEEKYLHNLWVMKTIYVPPHPFVERVKLEVAKHVSQIVSMYHHPHTHRQDTMHREFFERYIDWSREAVDIWSDDYPNQYPSAGSSEAIRETIAQYANDERMQGRHPQIHIFDGEYEGYAAYARAHHVEMIVHDRENYKETLEKSFLPWQRFYMSAPSGIDGNIWNGYEEFLRYLEDNHPESKLMLDLAYLNTTEKTPKIRTDSTLIDAIFISMSKSFPGTYYDRIGWVISKSPIPWLWGNQWFKNLSWLFLGKTLMENSPFGTIPTEMRILQLQVIPELEKTLWDTIKPSDVTFIATKPAGSDIKPFEKPLKRAWNIRYCLTPALIRLIDQNFHH